MKKLSQTIQIAKDFKDLVFSFRRELPQGARVLKVFGKPTFQGGPATKYKQVQSLLASEKESYSAIFCFSSVYTPIVALRILKHLGVKIIVNQNGVYYPAWFRQGWEKKNLYLRELNELSNHSFFQSQFALESYRRWVGEPPKNYSILYNPIDLKVFGLVNKRGGSGEAIRVLVFLDVSEFTLSCWEHILGFKEALKKSDLRNLQWIFVGRIHDANVFTKLGLKEQDAEKYFDSNPDLLPGILQNCDLALHLVYNDVCPNKVLECMASGVWVITLSVGGSAELVGDAGKVIQVEAGFDKPIYPTNRELENAVREYIPNREQYSKKAIERSKSFDLQTWLQEVEKKARE